MSAKTILVLGGGIGGVTAATHLRRFLGSEHRILIIEQSRTFSLCMANLWLMTGNRSDPAEGQRDYSKLAERGIDVIQDSIEGIDPASRTVRTSSGTLAGDYLIVALGASKNPSALPGFQEAALNLYDLKGALQIRQSLEDFRGGRIVVLVSRTPFSCPAAPYEAALLVDSLLRDRGDRERSEIAVYTPEDQPMPVAGTHVGLALREMLQERGIEFHGEQIAMKIEPGRRRVLFELDDAPFDVLLGVPPHVAPVVVRESGMTDASGWIPVDPATLATRHPAVFAIGDVTAVRLANGMFLPKAGVFADAEARIVAENIVAEIRGATEPAHFDGKGFCYIEVGENKAAYGSGTFYGMGGPRIILELPSERYRREKEASEGNALALLG